MSNLAVLSLKNRALIALITIVAAVFGGLALTSLKQELIPSIEFPALIVVSTYPGASPEVVNNDVSTPIENAIQGVPGLESSTATSTTNASIVQASFTYGTDLATAEQKMTQAINRISSQLPDGVEPNVISASIDDFPVIQVAVTGYDDAETIQAQLEASVVPELEDVDGRQRRPDRRRRRPARHDHPRPGGARRRGLHAAGDPRRARPERRAVPGRRHHRERPDPHRPDRLEGHVGRRDRGTPARALDGRAVPGRTR